MKQIDLNNGMIWLRGALDGRALAQLDQLSADAHKPGVRLSLAGLAKDALAPVNDLIGMLDPEMSPVRLVTFDKTAKTNWALPWHQDRVIAVDAPHRLHGFANWSRKHGIWHCEPPLSLLQQMLFVRVHLDDCTAEQGAMEIAVGSHTAGAVAAKDAEDVADRFPKHVCAAQRGDVLVLNMLTLHRSLPAVAPSTRRVLRIDYAATALPPPMAWAK